MEDGSDYPQIVQISQMEMICANLCNLRINTSEVSLTDLVESFQNEAEFSLRTVFLA